LDYTDLLFESDIVENHVGDFKLTADKKQSILIRLNTPYGSNVFHPEYGNKLYDILSDSIDESWISKAIAYEVECIEQDPAIKVVSIKPHIIQDERKVYFRIMYEDLESKETNELTWGEDIG